MTQPICKIPVPTSGKTYTESLITGSLTPFHSATKIAQLRRKVNYFVQLVAANIKIRFLNERRD